MRGVHTLAALAVTAFTVAAQGATVGSYRGGLGANCLSDANCGGDLVCNAFCPVIPGRVHCDIAGGLCEPRCVQTGDTLSGKSFASLDGTHSITFESKTTYRKTDGCPNTGGIHCEHITLSTGTFKSNGTRISLTSDQDAHDTLKVEPHCYDGLLDEADHVQLYPSN